MRPKSISQGLQEARALVAAGWCQGPYHRINPDGSHSYCAIGAVKRACMLEDHPYLLANSMDRTLFDAIEAVLDRAACRRTHRSHMSAIEYNEARRRTQAQVLALFDDALVEATK